MLEKVKVVISDTDMTEKNVMKSEMPEIHLQICLFHILRTFGREITPEKMGITSSEKQFYHTCKCLHMHALRKTTKKSMGTYAKSWTPRADHTSRNTGQT